MENVEHLFLSALLGYRQPQTIMGNVSTHSGFLAILDWSLLFGVVSKKSLQMTSAYVCHCMSHHPFVCTISGDRNKTRLLHSEFHKPRIPMHHCNRCPYFAATQWDLVAHVIRRHRHAGTFVFYCSARGCGRSFRNYATYKKHVHRCHAQEQTESSQADDIQSDKNELSGTSIGTNAVSESFLTETAFLLRLKTVHRLPNSVITDIIHETNALIQQKLHNVKSAVVKSVGDDQKLIINSLETAVNDNNIMFKGLCTEKEMEKTWTEYFHYVKPVSTKLTDEVYNRKCKNGYKMVTVTRYGYYAHFIEELQSVLLMPEVRNILASDCTLVSESVVYDNADGGCMKGHSFVRDHPDALLFALYTDDFALVNPIGSHRKNIRLLHSTGHY